VHTDILGAEPPPEVKDYDVAVSADGAKFWRRAAGSFSRGRR